MIFTAAQLSALPVLDSCDVLIAGGGVAGVAAALSAARAGAKARLYAAASGSFSASWANARSNTAESWLR